MDGWIDRWRDGVSTEKIKNTAAAVKLQPNLLPVTIICGQS